MERQWGRHQTRTEIAKARVEQRLREARFTASAKKKYAAVSPGIFSTQPGAAARSRSRSRSRSRARSTRQQPRHTRRLSMSDSASASEDSSDDDARGAGPPPKTSASSTSRRASRAASPLRVSARTAKLLSPVGARLASNAAASDEDSDERTKRIAVQVAQARAAARAALVVASKKSNRRGRHKAKRLPKHFGSRLYNARGSTPYASPGFKRAGAGVLASGHGSTSAATPAYPASTQGLSGVAGALSFASPGLSPVQPNTPPAPQSPALAAAEAMLASKPANGTRSRGRGRGRARAASEPLGYRSPTALVASPAGTMPHMGSPLSSTNGAPSQLHHASIPHAAFSTRMRTGSLPSSSSPAPGAASTAAPATSNSPAVVAAPGIGSAPYSVLTPMAHASVAAMSAPPPPGARQG